MLLSDSKAAQDMLGFAKADLRGKNVNIIIPSPFKESHQGYVKSYLDTGAGQRGLQCSGFRVIP